VYGHFPPTVYDRQYHLSDGIFDRWVYTVPGAVLAGVSIEKFEFRPTAPIEGLQAG